MNKVVSINRSGPLSLYTKAHDRERIPGAFFFVAGVILWVVLPRLILGTNGGLALLLACVGTGLAGVGWGLVRFYRPPSPITSCVTTRTVPQAPPDAGAAARRKVA